MLDVSAFCRSRICSFPTGCKEHPASPSQEMIKYCFRSPHDAGMVSQLRLENSNGIIGCTQCPLGNCVNGRPQQKIACLGYLTPNNDRFQVEEVQDVGQGDGQAASGFFQDFRLSLSPCCACS